MKWTPLLNAFLGFVYIFAVINLLHLLKSIRHDTPDNIYDGLGALSLLVLSVATMAFLFFYQPAIKIMEKKYSEAQAFFLKTLAYFGLITMSIFILISLQ